MTAARAVVATGVLLLLVAGASADEPLQPIELVHVPVDELNVLLQSQKRGLVLEYSAYRKLFEQAQARARAMADQPPVDGTLVAATGRIDLASQSAEELHTAAIEATYRVRVLADGPRSVPFRQGGLAFESVAIEGQGRFEEWKGKPRLHFEGAGNRSVRIKASAVVRRKGAQRIFYVSFPSASSMAFDVVLPPGIRGAVHGEGAPVSVATDAREGDTIRVRPARNGLLRIAWVPAAKGTDGPPILDGTGHVSHRIADGVVESRIVVHADVYRTPTDELTLALPADFAVHALSGKGVARYRRLEDRTRVRVQLQKPMLGRVTLTLQGERPYAPGPAVVFPNATLVGAIWHWTYASIDAGKGVDVREVRPVGGHRVASGGKAPFLRYALARAGARLEATVQSTAPRTESVSTYYLNLAEAGKNLLVTTTYRVIEGTVFALRPRVPLGFELRDLQINGQHAGFTRDVREDGTIDVLLQRGVPKGGEVRLAATLEQARTDWVSDGTAVEVPFRVPSSGANRQEGLVGIGADAAFEVLEQSQRDLVAVGAADLTARGISAEGLVYGYRLDGAQPEVTYEVRRRTPVLEADVVALLSPSPRRLSVTAYVAHEIRRAGVRELWIDVPAWAGDEVRFHAPLVRATERVDADDVPAGYARWRVALRERSIGRQAIAVEYFRDFDEDNWRLPQNEPLCVRIPLQRVRRHVVVHRADGLEVQVARGPARAIELTELPAESPTNVRRALDVMRLARGQDGIEIGVRKHDGAAVLNAVATLVELDTAVAKEGVLRTRARVHLFNVDRQFLAVALPPDSTLIGAIADGQPVKPLTDPHGAVLVPVATARASDARTVILLTYETRLEDDLGSSVEVPAPDFPGLEVLQTEHRVAFDPDLRVRGIEGDFGTVALAAPELRQPWILDAFGVLSGRGDTESRAPAASATVTAGEYFNDGGDGDFRARTENIANLDLMEPVIKDAEVADHIETDNDMDVGRRAPGASLQEGRKLIERLKNLEKRQALVAGAATPGDGRLREAMEKARSELRRLRVTDGLADMPAGVPPPQPAAVPEPEEDPPLFGAEDEAPAAASEDGGGGWVPGDDAEPEPGAGPGEGGAVPRRARFRGRRGERRKGLLSLDVPVVLGPHRVLATRMGAGGVMTITLDQPDAPARAYPLLLLLFTAAGLWFGRTSRGRKGLVVLTAAGLAGLMAFILGKSAVDWTAALVDAATLCLGLWLVAWLVRRVFVPHTLVRASTASAALVALLVVAGAAQADEPRPPVPPVEHPKRVFVPYDPARPGQISQDARVFLPFDTWETLFRAANPDLDPELVRLGRMVTVTDAETTVTVGEQSARGTAVLRFVKRGDGMVLTAWPLGGMAITEATLDGEPVQLLLTKGVYRVPVTEVGAHVLEVRFRVPVVQDAVSRRFGFQTVPFSGGRLHVRAGTFDGTVQVNGAGRVEPRAAADSVTGRWVVAYLGHARKIAVSLRERRPEVLPATVRMRGETRTIHSIRDGGSITRVIATAHVLQGAAPFVDFALPTAASVLDVAGKQIANWDTVRLAEGDGPPDTLRLGLARPAQGRVQATIRVLHPAAQTARTETLNGLPLRDVTGESGQIVLNHDPALRVDVTESGGLFRLARPTDKLARGPAGPGRVMGAWRFSTRPVSLTVRTERVAPRIEMDASNLVVFGDDHVRTALRATVRVKRAPVGSLTFALPGRDEIRTVLGHNVDSWWTEGEGALRRLRVRFRDLVQGDINLAVTLSRRLGGVREGLTVPRWSLEGARRDRCQVVLFALRDTEPVPGALPGLNPVPLVRARIPASPIDGARATHVFVRERPINASLPLVLRTPDLSVQAVAVSLVAPGEGEHRIEHLVLYDIERGSTDHLRLFVPDGGAATVDVIRTRDLREQRGRRATRTGSDGQEVQGTLYDILLQTPRSGVVAVTVTQVTKADRPVRSIRPEDVSQVRWFSMVRTYLDGQVTVAPLAGSPDPATWEDLPFVPADVARNVVVRTYVGRDPYALAVRTTRHALEAQAEAVVLSADAHVVIGMDGHARVRAQYRVFNRARQFLRIRLPKGAVLFGASSSGAPVKPLAGAGGSLLLPVPKVPLGALGHPVTVLFRSRVGDDFEKTGSLRVLLPTVEDAEVDRTIVRLFVPEGFDYDLETNMTAAEAADVDQELAEVALQECRALLDVAETGTLTQRLAATANGNWLLERAKVLNREDHERGRALAADIAQVKAELLRRGKRAVQDQSSASSRAVNVRQEEFGGNAANLVELDEVTNGKQDPARGNRASWLYNDMPPPDAQAPESKAELGQIKRRLKTALQEQRMNDTRLGNVRKVAPAQKAGRPGNEPSSLQSQADANFDWKQVEWLNGALRQAQADNRQLGTSAGAQAGVYLIQPQQRGDLNLLLDQAVLDFTRQDQVLQDTGVDMRGLLSTPRSGFDISYFRQRLGGGGGAGGGFRDLTSSADISIGGQIDFNNLHGNPDITRRYAARMSNEGVPNHVHLGASAFVPTTKSGLMGVDVELPQAGRVFYFRSLHGGAPIEIDVSKPGTPFFLRLVMFLAVLGAIAFGLLAWRRRHWMA